MQAMHDPVDVRSAGRDYQHGHARCAGAFHPKLVLLLGDEQVWLAIGSGNPTASGWGHNQELWLTARCDLAVGPQFLVDVACWLRDLHEVIMIPTWIAATLTEIAAKVNPEHVDASWPDVRVLGNLRQSLLEQLPVGPADELNLAAPFHDHGSKVIGALISRLRPSVVRVAIQPDWTVFDGRALVAATDAVRHREFRLTASEPPQHGKLVEWRTGTGRFTTLTGSANLTGAALLRSVADGGNCELAVLAPSASSLLPTGAAQDARGVAAQGSTWDATRATPADSAGVTLLGCALSGDTLLVELAAPAAEPVTIQVSRSGAPGSWLAVGVLQPGTVGTRLVLPSAVGNVVRAVVGEGLSRVESAPVFVTDPVRCRPRLDVTDEPRLARIYAPEDIFTDQTVAARFADDLSRLSIELRSRVARAPAAPTPVSKVSAPAATDRWADYLDACDRTLGRDLSRLVFPRPDRPLPVGSVGLIWSVDDISDTGEEAGEAVDEPDTPLSVTVPAIERDERARYRSWAARLVRTVTTERESSLEGAPDADREPPLPPLPLRMLVTRLYLTLLAAGIWGTELEWREDLGWLVWSLTPYESESDETPPEGLDHLRALLAVCMALLLRDTRLYGGGELDLITREAWDYARYLVADANPQLAEDLLLPATADHSLAPTRHEVDRTIELAGEAEQDPHAVVRAELESLGLELTFRAGIGFVTGAFTTPRPVAAKVATMLGRQDGAAVIAANYRRAVLLMWEGHTFAYTDTKVPVWRLCTLSPAATPMSVCLGNPEAPLGKAAGQLAKPSQPVCDIAVKLGVDLTTAITLLRRPTK
ncbi:MAG TPA: hypothetical protein VIS06_15905 [Mycobacteriales bacterium]